MAGGWWKSHRFCMKFIGMGTDVAGTSLGVEFVCVNPTDLCNGLVGGLRADGNISPHRRKKNPKKILQI